MTRRQCTFQIPRTCTHQVLHRPLHRSQRRLLGFKRPTITLLVLMLALGVSGPPRADEPISVRIEGQRLEASSNDPAATIMVTASPIKRSRPWWWSRMIIGTVMASDTSNAPTYIFQWPVMGRPSRTDNMKGKATKVAVMIACSKNT